MKRPKIYFLDPKEMEKFVDGVGHLDDRRAVKEPWEIVAEAEEKNNRRRDSRQAWETVAETNERAANAHGGGGTKKSLITPCFTVGLGKIWDETIMGYRPGTGECGCCQDLPLPPSTACLCCNATDIDSVQWPQKLTKEQEAKRRLREIAKENRARKAALKRKTR